MLELVVLSICMSAKSDGCNPALKAYYYEKPSIRRKAKEIKDELLFYTGDWITYAVPAIALASSTGSAQIKLSREWSVQGDGEETLLLFTKEF